MSISASEIKNAWSNKEYRAKVAAEHTEKMEREYRLDIQDCVANSYFYQLPLEYELKKYSHSRICPDITVEDLTSTDAIFKYASNPLARCAVLNFASYKYPGGGFLAGSKAQEECLCHDSCLYNVLSRFPEYYEENKKSLFQSLYSNNAIYTKAVPFFKNGKLVYCHVITCAAPNKASAQKYYHVTDEYNSKILKSRIKFVLDIAKNERVYIPILGAFGCGVFGQDAKEVAQIFKQLLESGDYSFSKVVFAVPAGNGNLEAFQEVFNGQK